MPSFEFITVTRVLASEIYLAEVLGTPELSAIGSDPDSAEKILRAKLKEFFSDDTLAETLSPAASHSRPPHRHGGRNTPSDQSHSRQINKGYWAGLASSRGGL